MSRPADLPVIAPPPSLKKQVIEALRTAILDGHFQPGDRLVEREVCELFDVSRTLLREALNQLEVEGIVQVIPHRGPIVAVYTVDDARAIYELRATLEEMAGRCFVERATEAELKAFETAFAAFRKSCRGKPGKDLLSVKASFYAALTAGAHNPVLVDMLRMIHGRVTMLRAQTLAQPGRLELSVAELGDIVQAVKRRDADGAARACRRHVENAAAIAIVILSAEEAEKALAAKKTRTPRSRLA